MRDIEDNMPVGSQVDRLITIKIPILKHSAHDSSWMVVLAVHSVGT